MTALTAALTEAEVLQELEPDQSEKGRPVTRLALGAPTVAILVAQVDADTATALVTSLAGDELFRVSAHHGRPMGEPEVVLDALADVVGEALEAASAMGRRVAELPVVVFAPVGGDPPGRARRHRPRVGPGRRARAASAIASPSWPPPRRR